LIVAGNSQTNRHGQVG